jgi:NitT/TauT family transport system permease protein
MDDSQPEHAPAQKLVAGAHGGEAFKFGDLTDRKKHHRDPFAIFLPNRVVSPSTMKLIIGVEAAVALLIWFKSPFKVLPQPGEVYAALGKLWSSDGLGQELITSFLMNVEALAWSAAISLVLAYLTVLPVFRPIVVALSKGRFLSMIGFSTVFTIMVGGGHHLKTSLLVYGITVFFVTSMASVIANIPKSEFDHARTLRMSEWRVVWEVVVLGTADKAFEVLRQNAAMGWMMLAMVEGIVKSEGGVGVLLIAQDKYFHLAEVFAIQIVILIVGLSQDAMIGLIRKAVCPYADMTLERK